jgi:hypothetical protein
MKDSQREKPDTDDRLLPREDDEPEADGEPGRRPIGTRLGAYGGGLAGAIIGTAVGGPPGGIVGTAVGAVAGGLTGRAAGEKIDPTVEDAFWRETYRTRPFVGHDESYETYRPAYRYGWESRIKHRDERWEDVEPRLGGNWDRARGTSSLSWERAQLAVRDAWHRAERAFPGDADGDGH